MFMRLAEPRGTYLYIDQCEFTKGERRALLLLEARDLEVTVIHRLIEVRPVLVALHPTPLNLPNIWTYHYWVVKTMAF